MCFVIAGLQPKTRNLNGSPQRCPRCGLYQAYTRQVDHYFSLFFIPLLRVKKGEPFLYCQRCQMPVGADTGTQTPPFSTTAEPVCRSCGRKIQSDYSYCPHCGAKLSSS